MSAEITVCSIDPELKQVIHKFKFRKEKTISAKIMKIDAAKQAVVLDEEYEDITVDEVRDELPPQQPRYIALSYVWKHDDGRVSFPLIFIYISPQGCKPELQMMYAGSKNFLVKDFQFTKVLELRNADDLTEEYILEQLKRVG